MAGDTRAVPHARHRELLEHGVAFSQTMTIRRRVHVEGRVQGVFFRDSCARQARVLGVSGSVRNRGDGGVEAVFEGDADAVDRMVAWCHHGPPRAVVTAVRAEDEPPLGDQWFAVR